MPGRHINRAKALAIIERELAKGHTREGACAVAGIDKVTFYRWIEDETLATRIEQAEGRAEHRHAGTVIKSAAKNPDDAWKWLERRRPKGWAPQKQVAPDVSINFPVTVVQMDLREIEAVERRHELPDSNGDGNDISQLVHVETEYANG